MNEIITTPIPHPREWWAVLLANEEGPAPNVVALFAYADDAERWGKENYAGRYRVARVEIA